jgi:hypothetical protein
LPFGVNLLRAQPKRKHKSVHVSTAFSSFFSHPFSSKVANFRIANTELSRNDAHWHFPAMRLTHPAVDTVRVDTFRVDTVRHCILPSVNDSVGHPFLKKNLERDIPFQSETQRQQIKTISLSNLSKDSAVAARFAKRRTADLESTRSPPLAFKRSPAMHNPVTSKLDSHLDLQKKQSSSKRISSATFLLQSNPKRKQAKQLLPCSIHQNDEHEPRISSRNSALLAPEARCPLTLVVREQRPGI